MNKFLPFVFGCICFATGLLAQNASDIVVPITVTTSNSPASITLNFPATANAVNTVIGRKQLFDTAWSFLLLQPDATTFTDVNVIPGIGFEYIVVKETSVAPVQRIGLVYAGIEVLATAYRGKMVLVVDDALSSPLSMELERLEQDLRGDGWQVVRKDIDVAAHTVPSVKALIRQVFDDDPGNTTAAFLIGNIPVPYSGEINPDAHPDHIGAWPTDYYYGDMNENAWTDNFVNNISAPRPANHNVPGDGKFDQSFTPTLAEIVVSRVDFSNLSGWDVSQTELYRRYLNKNHAFRTGAYKPGNRTLIDDNFGYSNGEAFAQNGWRNGNALTGPTTIIQGDFFNDTDNQNFLLGYGCGGGNYTGANGVGSSTNFQSDSVNIVFSMLFGSYFGDWDYETNPFMPSALASKGGILTCAWAGRPNWHLHSMGLGEPILTSTYLVWLNSFLQNIVYPPNNSDALIHVGMLGDPTLRAHAVQPPTDLVVTTSCEEVTLNWTASPDAALGYIVYRAPSLDSIFEPIVTATVNGITFTDSTPLSGMNYYQVKSFRLETTPTGSYYNQSIGTPASINFNTDPVVAAASPSPVACNGGLDGAIDLDVSGGAMGNFDYLWSNNSTMQNQSGLPAGTYTVTVTDTQGCTTTASAIVTEPMAINLNATASNVLCFGETSGQIGLAIAGGTPDFTFEWSDGSMDQDLSNVSAGTYTVTATDANGCTETTTGLVSEPDAIDLALTPEDVSCNGLSTGNVSLDVQGGTPGFTFNWSNGTGAQNLSGVPAGTYTVIVTDANGCTQSDNASVAEPSAIVTTTTVTDAGCAGATNGGIELDVSGGMPGYTFEWSDGSTDQNLSNVAAGTYTATITDNTGCTQTTTATVDQVTTLSLQISTMDVTCFGGTGGTASVLANGGDPDYSYLWSNTQTVETIGDLSAGTYTVVVTDAAGCTQSATAIVTEPTAISANGHWAALPCMTDIGTVTLTVSGGTAGYNFEWSTGAVTQNLENVAPGLYTVTVTDANGCTQTETNTVVQPAPELAVGTAFMQTSCSGITPIVGDLTLNVLGGTPGYTYLWSNGATTANQQDVLFGVYTVTVTDANGCTEVHENMVVQVFQPWQLQSTVTNVQCNLGTDGAISLNVSGANGPNYTYLWSNGSTSQNLTNIIAGAYTVTVTDESACTTTQEIVLMQPLPISVVDSTITAANCSNGFLGSISIGQLTGGTPLYSYLWSNGVTELNNLNVAPGTYTLTITDENACTQIVEAEVLLAHNPPNVLLNGHDTLCLNVPGTYALFPGVVNSYQWDAGANGTILSGQGTAGVSVQWSATGLQELKVVYTYDFGCIDSMTTSVFVDICIGTNTPVLPGVNIQPNPFSDRLTVLFDRPVQTGARLQLLDVQGRLILENTALTETTRLETGHLPAGSYVLQIIENGQVGIWKVVKY